MAAAVGAVMALLKPRRRSDDRTVFRLSGGDYRWNGWLGCQLESLEWTRKPAGTERWLYHSSWLDRPAVLVWLWRTERVGLKVRHLWAVRSDGTHDEHVARIEELRALLRRTV